MALVAPLLAAAALTSPGAAPASDLPTIEAPRATAPVLVAGTVRDEHGLPVAGPVSVSVMPRNVQTGDTYPVVAKGVADAAGQFEARVTDQPTLERIAKRQHGWVETITSSDNAASASAGVRTIRIWQPGGGRLAFTPRTVAARAEADGVRPRQSTPFVDLKVDQPIPALATRADEEIPGSTVTDTTPEARGGTRACNVTPLWKVKSREVKNAWTIVGELNNAYNDGTTGTFSYGEAGSTDTSMGIAVSVNSATFSISEETSINDAARMQFPPFKRRLARKMRTQFKVVKTHEERTCPSTKVTDVRDTIRAVSWEGGMDTSVKQPGALDACVVPADKSQRVPYVSGGVFVRDKNNAVRWTTGATAFGVSLTAQSGYSKNVVTEFSFGGPSKKQHWLCGQDGKQSATASGRIFSGRKA